MRVNRRAVADQLQGTEQPQQAHRAQRLEVESRREIEGQDGREVDSAEEAEGVGPHRPRRGHPQHVLHREHGDDQQLDDLQGLPEPWDADRAACRWRS